jgi:O-acetylhomoserine (thiol)-lyase
MTGAQLLKMRAIRRTSDPSSLRGGTFSLSAASAQRRPMRSEAIFIHGGFGCDPATRAVAPPIHQNVAYEFESADEAAAMFDLEVPGFRYSRIANPTTDILERRVAQLEGGVAALAVASDQAALNYAFPTLADRGGSIVAPPQLYGTTHTLLAHILARNGVEARFAKSDGVDQALRAAVPLARSIAAE